ERLIELEAEDDRLASELANLKARQEDLSRLREGAGGYQDALIVQKERLDVSSWLASNTTNDPHCPLCGSNMDAPTKELKDLQANLKRVEKEAVQLAELPAAVDRDVQQIRQN